MDIAGVVAVKVKADLTDLDKGLDQARQKSEKFDKSAASSLGRTEQAARNVGVEGRKAGAAITAANDNISASVGRIGKFYSSAINSVKAFAAAAGSALAVSLVVAAADAYTKLSNQIKLATTSSAQASSTMGQLFEIANANGQSVGALGDLFARMKIPLDALNISGERLINVTRGIAAALLVGGKSQAESAGALQQLGQAMGSGIVRAEEFNSIMEGAPVIAQAAAAGFGTLGISVAELRNRVVAGQVSSEEFFKAMEAGLPAVEAKAKSFQMTIGGAIQVISNGFLALVGAVQNMSGVFSGVALVLSTVGVAMYKVAAGIQIATQFFTGLYNQFAVFRVVVNAASAALQAYIIIAAAAFAIKGVQYLASLATGFSVVAKAVWAMNAALLANPLGVMVGIALALGLALYKLNEQFNFMPSVLSAINQAFQSFGKVAEGVINSVIAGLNLLIDGLNQVIRLFGGSGLSNLSEIKVDFGQGAERIKSALDSGFKSGSEFLKSTMANAGKMAGIEVGNGMKASAKPTGEEIGKAASPSLSKAISSGAQEAHKMGAPVLRDAVAQGGKMAGSTIAEIMSAQAQKTAANAATIFSAAGIEFSKTAADILTRAGQNVAELMKRAINASLRQISSEIKQNEYENNKLDAEAELARAQAFATRTGQNGGSGGYGGSGGGRGGINAAYSTSQSSNGSTGSTGSGFVGGGGGGGKSGGVRVGAEDYGTKASLGAMTADNDNGGSGGNSNSETKAANVTIVNVTDPEMAVNAINTRAGNQALINFIVANAEEIRATLGVA